MRARRRFRLPRPVAGRVRRPGRARRGSRRSSGAVRKIVREKGVVPPLVIARIRVSS